MWRMSMLVVILSACFTSTAWAGKCCEDAATISNLPGFGMGEDCEQHVAIEKAFTNATATICVDANKPAWTGRPCSKDGNVCTVGIIAR